MTLLVHLISHSHVTSSNDGYFVSWPAINVKCCYARVTLSCLLSP